MKRLLVVTLLLASGCGSEPNACGGQAPLEAVLGDACGACGRLVCDGTDGLRCEGGEANACGGCGALAGTVGDVCGTCGAGTLACDGANTLTCVDDRTNACGGCAALAGAPGDACGTCGGVLDCDGTEATTCVESVNACGGCAGLVGSPGEGCGVCGAYQCESTESVACLEGPDCAEGATCDDDTACVTGNCSNGRCAPLGWAFIPAGTFTMGAPSDERGFHPDRENGQHTVTLTRPYLAKATTVTQGEWFAVTGTRPSYFDACGDDCPVERVSWWEMLLYADMLSRAEGREECYGALDCRGTFGEGCAPGEIKCTVFTCDVVPEAALDCTGYRLPTEAEWEYMARAGTTTPFLTASGELSVWSSSPPDPELDLIAWYTANSHVTYPGGIYCSDENLSCGPHPVGLKAPNAWGLFDMTGNVWERVFDRAGDYPEPGSVVVDPTGQPTGDQRRLRGGPFNAWGQYMRVAYRTGPRPETRSYNNGFRLVRTLLVSD